MWCLPCGCTRVRHIVYVTLYCCLVAIATVVHKQFHLLYTLGTDPKENTTPLLCRCPATGPKRKHYLPIVLAKQQPQNRPQRKRLILCRCCCQATAREWTPKQRPPHCCAAARPQRKRPCCIATAHRCLATYTQTNTYGQPDAYFRFYIYRLAETPGIAQDYIRNEGTRNINLVLYKNNYNLQRFKPPRERAPVLNESEAGWAPEQTPKKRLDFI
jgi:hypothetical protein